MACASLVASSLPSFLRRIRGLLPPLLCLLFLGAGPVAAGDDFDDDFDAAGSTMAGSELSTLIVSGDGSFVREALDAATAAPDTSPPLPINVGGDQELRYFEPSLAPSGSYAVTPDVPERTYADVQIDAHVGIGFAESFGARSAALLARFSGSSIATVQTYAAMLTHLSPATAGVSLQRITNGIGSSLATSSAFAFDPANEHVRLHFSVIGEDLALTVWRVAEDGGQVVESEVDLDDQAAGVQSTLVASDATLASGRVGVRAFARGDNSVFFDEIAVAEVLPEPHFLEDFDQPGADVTLSELSRLILSGNGTYERQALAAGTAAPDTAPPLVINVGGDKELRYFEQSLAPSGGYAVTPAVLEHLYTDVLIDGYVGIGYSESFGARSASFLARFSGTALNNVNAYAASVNHSGSSATLSLQRITNGVSSTLVSSSTFLFIPTTEHLRLSFSAVGSTLSVQVWRVRVIGGVVTETEIDLIASQAGVQNTLTTTHGALLSGGVGVRSFARKSNSIFYDEIAVFDLAP